MAKRPKRGVGNTTTLRKNFKVLAVRCDVNFLFCVLSKIFARL